jgi:hypothetical protein
MRALPIVLLAVFLVSACNSAAAPEPVGETIRVTGTVQRYNLEGGFWAVRGDDGVTYDPMNGLAPAFQRDNLRVSLVAKLRGDMGGTHMVGPIVEVISIQPL